MLRCPASLEVPPHYTRKKSEPMNPTKMLGRASRAHSKKETPQVTSSTAIFTGTTLVKIRAVTYIEMKRKITDIHSI
jgi:hypothetical protein